MALVAIALVSSGAGFLSGPPTGGAQDASLSVQNRIDQAAPGETVYIDPGVYNERIVIDKAIKLKGLNEPVIDGGGEGDVVLITADGASISGFDIRNGGKKFSEEAAGVKVEGAGGVEVATNSIKDVRFGIYLVDSEDATVAYNTIDPQPDVDVGRRGYAIYLWEVKRSGIFNNAIKSAGDGIHLEFSEGITIGENTVEDSRYGLHFMYSDGNKVVSNVFRDNLAGAVMMFSHNMLLKDNDLSSNRKGASGVGALFKDCDDVFAEGNRFLRNKFGITVDGTPQEVGSTAVFRQNLFALNDTGIGLMSNSPIMFIDNAMIDNTVQVTALGGALTSSPGADGVLPVSGSASGPATLPDGITWSLAGRGNYWSDYHGYDRNGDGVGDIPYEPQPPFAGALADNDSLRLFQFTLAQEAIDMAADMFPLYRYDAVMTDDSPLMSPPGPALSTESELDRGLFAVSALLLAVSGLALAALLDIDLARVTRGLGGRRPQEGGA